MKKKLLLLLPALLGALLLVGPALFARRDFRPVFLCAWQPWRTWNIPWSMDRENRAADMDAPEKTFLALPEIVLAKREIARGSVPLWNPFNRTGGPLLSHSLEGLLYPPHWILFLLPPGKAFALLALFSFLLAFLFTYLLLRLWELPRAAALGGGLFFAFSSQMAANAHFYMRQDTLALLPGLLWAFEAWRLRGGRRYLAALALLTAGTWTAGFPPFAYASTLVLGAWTLLSARRQWRESGRGKATALLLGTALACLAGLLLAAPQLVPLAQYLPWSQRTLEAAGGDPRSWGADPATLLTAIVPDIFGSPWTTREVPYLQSPLTWLLFLWHKPGVGLVAPFNFTENVFYLGPFPLLLALWGMARPWKGKRGPLLVLLAALLVPALGLEGGLVTSLVPGLRRACPERLLPAALLILTFFSARGLQLLARGEAHPRGITITTLSIFALMILAWILLRATSPEGWSRWVLDTLASRYRGPSGRVYTPGEIEALFLHRPILEAARRNLLSSLGMNILFIWSSPVLIFPLMGLVRKVNKKEKVEKWRKEREKFLSLTAPFLALMGFGGLLVLAIPLCPTFPSVDPFSGTPLHKALVSERTRLAPSGGVTLARVGPAGTEPDLFPADLPTALGVRDLQAYAFVDRRSHLPMERAWKALSPKGPSLLFRKGPWIGNLPDSPLLTHPVLDLYGVTHLLALRKPAHGSFRVLLEEKGPGGSYVLLERKPRPPRARVVPRALPLEDAKALERMASPSFRPGEVAFLPPREKPVAGRGGGEVTFLEDRPDRVVLEVRGSGGGLLLLSDTWAPGWSARLDGRKVPLLRADTCFRGVVLPRGDHRVEFLLSKAPFRLGLLLFAAGLLLLGGLLFPGKSPGPEGGHP